MKKKEKTKRETTYPARREQKSYNQSKAAICEAQGKRTDRDPCSKFIKNFKMATGAH